MKVGVFVTGEIAPSDGGGFSYIERLLRGIDSFNFDSPLEICFVGRVPSEKVALIRKYIPLSGSSLNGFFNLLEKTGFLPFFRNFRLDLNFQKKRDISILKKNGVDVLIFLRQTRRELDDFPFIAVNWDVGHLSSHAFPEFVHSSTFYDRERWYQHELRRALMILVESQAGRNELIRYCGFNEAKVDVVPLFAGKVTQLSVSTQQQDEILLKLKLEKEKYFYYPAQFWAHKNHYNLVRAFAKMKSKGELHNVKLVFSGSNQGNKEYIASVAEKEGVASDVLMLGFISNEEVFTLYKNSIALVMPSFLGPTNMPLLEAQAIGVPVICSDFEGHREICGDAAIYINPADEDQIAIALLEVVLEERRSQLIAAGLSLSAKSEFNLEGALRALNKSLMKLLPIRKAFR